MNYKHTLCTQKEKNRPPFTTSLATTFRPPLSTAHLHNAVLVVTRLALHHHILQKLLQEVRCEAPDRVGTAGEDGRGEVAG